MKRVYLLLLTMTFCFTQIYSQNPHEPAKYHGSFRPSEIIKDDSIKIIYTYDGNGVLTDEFRDEFYNNAWVHNYHSIYTYDANGNLLSWLWKSWFPPGNWADNVRWTYTYDGNNNRLTELYESWNGYEWQYTHLHTYTYSMGHLTQELRQNWTSNQWVNDVRESYSYNDNTVIYTYESWATTDWGMESRDTYTRDANGNIISILQEDWVNGGWLNYARNTSTYNGSGKPLTSAWEAWDNNQWVNNARLTYTYTSHESRLTTLGEEWQGNAWVNSIRWTYTENSYGSLISEVMERWLGNAWENYSKISSSYDNDGNAVKGESFKWANNNWVPAQGTIVNTCNNGLDSIFYQRCTVAKASYIHVTGLENEQEKVSDYRLSQNYPNPFNPTTIIEYTLPRTSYVQLNVYDILGKEVKSLVGEIQSKGLHKIQFNAVGLPAGIYIYRLKADGFTSSKKIVFMK